MKRRFLGSCVFVIVLLIVAICSTNVALASAVDAKTASPSVHGDIDGNGETELIDAILLAKAMAGLEVQINNPKNMDVNLSGAVDTEDLIIVLKLLAGFEWAELVEEQDKTTTSKPLSKSLQLMQKVLDNISVKNVEIPKYDDGELYEIKDNIFLTEINGVKYCYTLLTDSPMCAAECMDDLKVKGLHIWETNEVEMEATNILEKLPNTEGIKFKAHNPENIEMGLTEISYSLQPYNDIHIMDISTVAGNIAKKRVDNDYDVKENDYNLNGVLDEEDLEIMLKHFVSYLKSYFSKMNRMAYNRYVQALKDLGHKNVVMLTTSSTAPVEYAFQVSVCDLVDASKTTPPTPVQVLPLSYFEKMGEIPENATYSDEQADYIAYNPLEKEFYKVNTENSQHWGFQSGYYVYLLDEQGKFIKKEIF